MTDNGRPPEIPLDRAAQLRFLEAFGFHRPRVWAFLEAEVAACQARGGDVVVGCVALAQALIDVAQDVMEVRQALLAAGGDADVAALMLGVERARQGATDQEPQQAAPPPRRRPKRQP